MKVKIISLITIFCLFTTVVSAKTVESDFIESMIHIKARPDFQFRYDTTNSVSGEKSAIEKDYYLSKYKVTNEQYLEFVSETGHKVPNYWKNGIYPQGKGTHPVLNVSYSDAVSFCQWLSSKYDGWKFRLPTEAEWENASMGMYYGDLSVKYPNVKAPSYNESTGELETSFNFNGVIASKLLREYGSDYIINYIKGDFAGTSEKLGECISISKNGGVSNWANHGSEATKGYFLQTDLYKSISDEGGYTTPVGTYEANSLGLYDMAGNSWDLTSSKIIAENGLESGVECYAVRGGSWYATARSCTFYYRGEGRKDSPSATVGFRLAADCDTTTEDIEIIKNEDGKTCRVRANIVETDIKNVVCYVVFYNDKDIVVSVTMKNISTDILDENIEIPDKSVKCKAFICEQNTLKPLSAFAVCENI